LRSDDCLLVYEMSRGLRTAISCRRREYPIRAMGMERDASFRSIGPTKLVLYRRQRWEARGSGRRIQRRQKGVGISGDALEMPPAFDPDCGTIPVRCQCCFRDGCNKNKGRHCRQKLLTDVCCV